MATKLDDSLQETARNMVCAKMFGQLNSMEDMLKQFSTGKSGISVAVLFTFMPFMHDLENAKTYGDLIALGHKYELYKKEGA